MAKKYFQLGTILKKLLFDKNMRPIDLSRQIHVPAPTIHRLITGKSTRPYQSSLKPIAEFFSISVEQLIGDLPLQTDTMTSPISRDLTEVNLIPWKEITPPVPLNKSYEKIPVYHVNASAFATQLEDSAMEPIFPLGTILIFDPARKATDRSYVLVQLQGGKLCVFRQLLIDVDSRYLKCLNPDLSAYPMRLLHQKDMILGVLVETRQLY